jgi:CRISPR system Cascade subunit CasC
MRLEVHILQNFAPSNLNRDDTGSPKDAEFGGYRRARVSSQCAKRAVRRFFEENAKTLGFTASDLAVRTKRLLEEARRRLSRNGRDTTRIDKAVTSALAAGRIAMKTDDPELTQYLLFLGEREIGAFVALVDKHFDVLAGEPEQASGEEDDKKKKTAKQKKAAAKEAVPKEIQDAVPELLDGGKSADLALFGRMLADLPSKNVDAACQVAHAISTNRIHSMEMDYYTAVDDINNDNPGADMIGTVEFNSACLYRYANLDLGQLSVNLQPDHELTKKTAAAFLKAFIHAIPTGKQNTFAAHNPPSLVFAIVSDGPPMSLANAFVKPVCPRDSESLVEKSIEALDSYYGRLTGMYGDCGMKKSAVCHSEAVTLTNLKENVGSVAQLIGVVVAAAFPAGGER